MNLSLGVPQVKFSKSFDILFRPFPLSPPLVFNWFGTALRCHCHTCKTHPICIGGKKVMNLSSGVPKVKFSKSFDILFRPFLLSPPLVFNWFGTALRCDCHTFKTRPICIGGKKSYEFIFGCTPSQIFEIFWHTFRTFPIESSPCFQLIWDRLEMPLSHI